MFQVELRLAWHRPKSFGLLKSWLGWNPREILKVRPGVLGSFYLTAILPEASCAAKAGGTRAFTGDRTDASVCGESKWASRLSDSNFQGTGPCSAGGFAIPAQFPCPSL